MPWRLFGRLVHPRRRIVRLDDRADFGTEIADRAPDRDRAESLRRQPGGDQRGLAAVGEAEQVRALDAERVHESDHVAGVAVIKVERIIARLRLGQPIAAQRRRVDVIGRTEPVEQAWQFGQRRAEAPVQDNQRVAAANVLVVQARAGGNLSKGHG